MSEITEEMVEAFANVYYGGGVPHLMAEIRAALTAALQAAEAQPLDIANAPEFKPCVIHYEEGDFSQMLLEDCATVTGWPYVLVQPLLRMSDRAVIGFQWDGKVPSAPTPSHSLAARRLALEEAAREARGFWGGNKAGEYHKGWDAACAEIGSALDALSIAREGQ